MGFLFLYKFYTYGLITQLTTWGIFNEEYPNEQRQRRTKLG